ncbi:hypothetical protein D9619_009734 [Psilocybe cf. subviscida]|uniref:Velvet domain-containing protein n=1 Tax=Psilocybe cf. subviscida TaxID=2480587 RepID=A0A8H5F6N8_9AGAR|nr:hypothetical protein D9619_009734 [Psilocybe cf. subviscida]
MASNIGSSPTMSPQAQAGRPYNCCVPESDTTTLGAPIYFSAGPYASKVIRMEIHEVQKANLGRKYANVDRRPLDPPPVAHLRLFEVHHAGTPRQREVEMTYDDTLADGLVCYADLFPVPPDDAANLEPYTYGPYGSYGGSTESPVPSSSSPARYGSSGRGDHDASYRAIRSRAEYPLHAIQEHKVIYQWGNFPITEESKKTTELVGSTFVQPCVIDYQGGKQMFFVFADLAVRLEGTFILRYRVFNLYGQLHSQATNPVAAECYGGRFRVYSTKEFPGLPASTELTKLLARWGVRVNLRETERKRRRRDEDGSPE